jgi:hopanoid-associated phosphorylase
MGDVRRRGTRPLLVVTGTKREGAVLAGPGVTILAGGGDAAKLAEELDRLVPLSGGVLSFGMAGALAPELALGDWVLGSGVMGGWEGSCDPIFSETLLARLRRDRHSATIGPIFANGELIPRAADKAALHATSGAIAADMESHLAGAAAARHGVRFAVLRCISDTADADLPPAVAVAMKPGGGLATLRVTGSILRHPLQVPALLRTGRRFGRAFETLTADGRRILKGG